MSRQASWIVFGVLFLLSATVHAQQNGPKSRPEPIAPAESIRGTPSGAPVVVNYDSYYRFPFSFGAEYQSLFPVQKFPEPFAIFEVGGSLRWPVPALPLLKPSLRFGLTQFNSLDKATRDTWSHSEMYVAAGVLASHRFGKLFGAGLGIYAGYDYGRYPNMTPSGEVLMSPGIIADLIGVATVNPFFNLSINIQPMIRYERSLSALTKYDGFLWGIGANVNLRLGTDPDSTHAITRSIRVDSVRMSTVFAAMQSYYAEHPVGSVRLTNIDKNPVTDVEISFFQRGYMDSPTPAATIKRILPGTSVTVKLPAIYNSRVFTTEGVTPLTGEVDIKYFVNGKAAEQSQAVTYDLQDKTALTWDDNRKVGAFITSADSTIRNYASFVRRADKDESVGSVNQPLQTAMEVYSALSKRGIIYQPDPSSPFAKVQSNTVLVDSINFARDTLKRETGDCDDLTVLFDTVLETVGIETGYVTVPGHIFAVFNTKESAQDYRRIYPNPKMSIIVDGEVWVPVEITLLGRGNFMEAWRTGVEEYGRYRGDPAEQLTRTHAAQSLFRPVALTQDSSPPGLGDASTMRASFRATIDRYSQILLSSFVSTARRRDDAYSYNVLGIESAKLKRYRDAKAAFEKAIGLNGRFLPARINLGSLDYLQGKLKPALEAYRTAEKILLSRQVVHDSILVKVDLNISKTLYDMGSYDAADSYYQKAVKISPIEAKTYSYLAEASTGPSGARAAETAGRHILFVNGE